MRAALLALLIAAPATAQVNTERMRRQLGDDRLHLALDASAAVARGNADFLQVGLGGRLDLRAVEDDLAFVVGRLDLARSDGASFVDRSFVHARYNTDLVPRLVWETFVQVERNGPQRLRARTLIGGGVRYEVVDRDSVGLAAGLLPMFEREVLDEALGEPTSVVRASSYVSARLSLANATLSTTTYLQPQISEPDDFRVLTQAAVEVGVTRWVRIRVRADLRYDSRPPVGVEPTDVRIENGLVLVIPAGDP
ncbi:DUF481 domain-containing protein [Rubrivirga sp. IMCC45206]|uniref:DUF481 domain-containing protein n=1 Tax=Rubrivirga sp. IMCC45206 TaxID=3391614 RepID=UPI0039901923